MGDHYPLLPALERLGGQVLTEIESSGGKKRTFVYAGGSVLAWQVFYGPYPGVVWEHRDASNASFTTDARVKTKKH